MISAQPYVLTAYYLRPVITDVTAALGAVIDGRADVPGGLASILGAISQYGQQLAAIEASIFEAGLSGAAASPQQLSTNAASVDTDAAALPGLPNLGIGSAIGGLGSLVGFALQAAGGIASPVLGLNLGIPAVISSQPYVLSAYFLRPVITDVTAALGAVIDGRQDIPGAVSAILDTISQRAQQLAAIEGGIFGGGLLEAAASPQQLSATTISTTAAEPETPDPVGTDTPEVKSLASKTAHESAPASTGGAAPESTDVSTTLDKDTPAAEKDAPLASDKDKTPATDVDKTAAADKDKTPAKEPDKTPSDDKDKTPAGQSDKTPAADKDKSPSGDKDKTSAGDKDKTSSSDHDKG